MASGAFIAGTDTGVGKTRVTVALLQALGAAGIRAAGMKPVAAGVVPTSGGCENPDVMALRAASCTLATPADQNPYGFDWPLSPHIGAERLGVVIDPGRVLAAHARLAAQCEVILVEGAGGWLAPIGPAATMADIAQALGLPVVLVVGLRLGCLNHALLSARAIQADGLRLAGWIGSVIDPAMEALPENLAALRTRLSAPELGHLPFAPDTGGDAVALAGAARAVRSGRGPQACV